MLSIHRSRGSADSTIRYFFEQKIDYYQAAGHGCWYGQGAEALNLAGTVERDAFRNLLLGFSPDGTRKLVQNAGTDNRHGEWDLTFSAPKSVSVLWAMSPPEVRAQIELAHDRAVKQTLDWLEDRTGISRRGKGGRIQAPASLIFASFQEGVSRALDPQLHTHCVLLNIGVRQDGSTGSLETTRLFDHKLQGGTVYQAALADGLRTQLGLKMTASLLGCRVEGVPEELCRSFSKRRQIIEKVMMERGLEGAEAAGKVTLATRPNKPEVPADRLFAGWQAAGRALGWGPAQAHRLVEHRQPLPGLTREEADRQMDQTVESGMATNQPRNRTSRAAMQAAILAGADAQALIGAFDRWQDRLQLAHEHKTPIVETLREPRKMETPAMVALERMTPVPALDAIEQEPLPRIESPQPRTHPRKYDSRPLDRNRELKPERNEPESMPEPVFAQPQERPAQVIEPKRPAAKRPAGDERDFLRKLLRAWAFLHPEHQNHKVLNGLIKRTARETGLDLDTARRIASQIVPAEEWSVLRKERRSLFPKSLIKPIRDIRAPVISLLRPPRAPYGTTHLKLNLKLFEVRLQNRRLFPKAPRWSPLRRLALPAVRLARPLLVLTRPVHGIVLHRSASGPDSIRQPVATKEQERQSREAALQALRASHGPAPSRTNSSSPGHRQDHERAHQRAR